MFRDAAQPTGRSGKQVWWWAALAGGLVVLLGVIAAGAVIWLRGSGGSPPASWPRVTDTRAKLTYPIPPGWAELKDIIEPPESSGLRRGKDALVLVLRRERRGPGLADPEQLKQQAVLFGAIVHPRLPREEQATPEMQGIRALKIDGRDAATVSFRMTFPTEDPLYVRVVLMQTTPGEYTYLYGAVRPYGEAARRAIDNILDNVKLMSAP